MPPRIRLRPRALCVRLSQPQSPACILHRGYASLATPSETQRAAAASAARYPPTQPPSHKPPETRKSQLHRQYQSLLKSSPLILIFQHNNVKAVEWTSIRRELAFALKKVDAERATAGHAVFADEIKLQVIQTGIFASALRIVEFFNPESQRKTAAEPFTHGLSRRAYELASNKKLKSELEPLLSGPLAVLTFPAVSPLHLKEALKILSPSPDFPAPKRKANPAYHEADVQSGLHKLMLLGARVEGKVFDLDGTRWVGGIPGGIDGLRAQLVGLLQGVGSGITNALEGASKSLYFTMEARKLDMEEQAKPDVEADAAAEPEKKAE